MAHMRMVVVMLFTLHAAAADKDALVTMKGEIVDLHCYISRGEHGEGHAGCANACISRDVPAGFLAEDGKLYVLVNERPISVKEKVAGKAGRKVTVHGTLVERDGVRALKLASVD